MNKQNRKKSIILIILHFFLAIGALGGGTIFIINPSGELAGMSVSLLDGSPFQSYFIPGLILFIIFGILPLIIGSSLIGKWDFKVAEKVNIYKEKHWSWTFSLYIGFALIIWITVQVYIIRTLSILHFIFILFGIVIQIVTLLPSVQKKYIK